MQARIRPPISISGHSPNLGALLSTAANSDVLMQINSRFGSTFFGDHSVAARNVFLKNIVEPMRQSVIALASTANALALPNVMVDLSSIDAFRHIPECMHMPILTYAPVRALLEQGRIDGFGWMPENLPEEDDWGRYLENGHVKDLAEAYDRKTETVRFSWTMYSTDEERTLEQIDYVERARDMIDHILETTDLDPTSIENMRG